MHKNTIEIDLSSSNYNNPIGSVTGLIQLEAFQTLRQQITKDLGQTSTKTHLLKSQTASVNTNELYPPGSGLTYFIDGTRGAGKSTFLDFTYKYFGENLIGDAASVKPLLYLDPSRIESSEIVLLHILKHLKYLMDSCPQRGSDWESQREKFREIFKQMAGGLQLFVSKTDNLKDLDAELFLDYGLDRAADSQRLRRLLHQTINLVCNTYQTHALLVAIDDADTKFSNAIEVLECIRKYLDTPQLVVLVTGDMEMYSLLVQNHFQQDFANDSKGFSDDRKNQQTRMVGHLEEQYLLKLFPIHRRVQLKTLHTLIERMRKSSKPEDSLAPAFIVRRSGGEDAVHLLEAIDAIATEGLRLRDRHDLDLFREHVLKQPVRSVLQLLSYYYQLRVDNEAMAREAASSALRGAALSSLYQHDIDVESIAEGDLHAVIDAAFDLCQLDGEPDTAIYLRPQSRNTKLRHAYTSLAADVARLCENDPAKAITYMVSMAGSSSILQLVTVKESRPGEGELQRKVKQYLSVGRQDNALNWALHATAALIGASTSKGLQLHQGIIGVRVSKKTNAEVSTFDANLSAAFQNYQSSHPAIAFSQSAVKGPSNTRRYLSIFNILGLISNLLDINDPNGRKDEILRQLNKISSIQTVSMPKWEDDIYKDGDLEISEISNDDDPLLEGLANLVTQINNWLDACQQMKKHFHPSAVLMGKIWNRLHFSLDNISAAMRLSSSDEQRCGKAMELFAWALINACLVEEVDYHYQDRGAVRGKLNRKNPRTSAAIVINKFKNPLSDVIPNNKMSGFALTAGSIDGDSPSINQSISSTNGDSANTHPYVSPTIAPLTFMIATSPLILGLIMQDDGKKDDGKKDDGKKDDDKNKKNDNKITSNLFTKILNIRLQEAKISLSIDEYHAVQRRGLEANGRDDGVQFVIMPRLNPSSRKVLTGASFITGAC
ncbi:ATPases with chaperone activity, ATP-binding subunit [Laribacter hongkongensis HLHK9]|uniref:ATPases with chaperone activity, ATP-binding subunit n=1 Tax=Laribacter hongkongensis (strain HLHK9) TaxID=557598 RepID=C1D8H5_LARHH|nr:hypothetical protein [Laribacter hongkongensis]ACO74765.1 ATPases with chaperone activity, ATP-binding subunit [Laribacter hongkongensis HLHK9]